MWAAQFFGFEEPHRWMTSGGLGTMGYGLPAALGVQVAHPDSLVIDIAGDASVQMTMQEMSTAVQYELPIKIFILNNQYMGMVRQWQQLLHGNRLSHSYSEAMPDFVMMAEAYGGVGFQVFKPGDLDGAIMDMIKVKKPVLFDCRVATLEQPASAYFMEERHDPNETHTLSVLVQNEPGVLARVIGLFSGRGYNIESLTVSETESQKHVSRITIVTTGTPMVIQQIKHQLDRMIPIYKVVDMTLTGGRSIERELAMV